MTLAISLHAARDELRDVLVPINRKYPVANLVGAAQGYAAKSGRRVSYEWVMLAGVNDTERDAKELGRLLRRKLAHVNLIPFNPVEDTPYRGAYERCHPPLQRPGRGRGPERHRSRHARPRGRRRMRAAARARHAAARHRLLAILYAGTSGFSYPTWKGVFYPKSLAGAKMLEYYSDAPERRRAERQLLPHAACDRRW